MAISDKRREPWPQPKLIRIRFLKSHNAHGEGFLSSVFSWSCWCFALPAPISTINFTSNHALQRVIDETNRSDPNWQLLELEAQRAVIPDEQNSAINLMNATRLMPPNWPRWDFAEESDMKNLSPDELEELRENFLKATPTVQLNAQQVAALRKELKRASAALAELHQIADKPRGRYPITYAKNFISTSPPHTPETRILAELLSYDALVRAQDRNLDGALTACRCIIHAQRAIGDEPMLISLLVRMALHRLALGDLERILAQGESAEAALAPMQKLLGARCDDDRR